jgi:hypothetical protein
MCKSVPCEIKDLEEVLSCTVFPHLVDKNNERNRFAQENKIAFHT